MVSRLSNRAIVLLALMFVYLLFIQRYRPYEIDNPWFLSFSFNWCHDHLQTDGFKQFPYPFGMDGVRLFGKIASAIRCLVLNTFGWTPASFITLNAIFACLSLLLWWSGLAKLGYRERWITKFIVFLAFTEAMFGMVEKARYEFLCFFLLSAAFWLASRGFEGWAGFVAMMAVETEPIAIAVPMVIIVLLLLRSKNRKLLIIKLGFAALFAILCYRVLHPGAIYEIFHSSYHRPDYIDLGEPTSQTNMGSYYIERVRHLPELVMLIVGSLLYWKHRKQILDHTAAWCSIAVCSFFLLPYHANTNYLILAMPFFVWMAFDAYDRSPGLKWLPRCVFVCLLFQYAYLYRLTRMDGFNHLELGSIDRQISAAANAAGTDTKHAQVCGESNLWFAHPEHYHECSLNRSPSDIEKLLRESSVFVCLDERLQTKLDSGHSMLCKDLRMRVSIQEVSTVDIRGHLVHFLIHQ